MKINSTAPDKHLFTKILGDIVDCPKTLYFIGNFPENEVKRVAIVGSRKTTVYGREIAYQLAYNLAKRGVIIISGLALGIDGEAHRGALAANGTTIAVLANGLETIYPSSHAGLAAQIVDGGGAVISEYPPGTPPLPHQFLERNRIVSGLSDAIIVVEAAQRSGTLSTVAHGLEQGKDIFAVPGNITSPLSAGCNALIAQGAQPVTSVDSLIEQIVPSSNSKNLPLPFGDNEHETTLLQLLAGGIRDGEVLLEKSSLGVRDFNQALTMLEIKGAVRALGNNHWGLR